MSLWDNIHTIIATIDEHDAGVYPDGRYVCPCGVEGTEQQWEFHVADVLAGKLGERVVDLPAVAS